MQFPRNSSIKDAWRASLNNLSWWHNAYLVDWGVAWFLWLFAAALRFVPVYEREFSLRDGSISHPHAEKERVPSFANWYISVAFPLTLGIYWGLLRKSSHEAHHAALACWSGFCLSHFVTDVLKNRIGRLRPDFLARCAYDAATMACSGPKGLVRGGRMSFPSGHSSTAFAGFGFLFLFFAGKYGACNLTVTPSQSTWHSSRLFRLLLTVCPLFFAAWIAISRLEDYRHHKEDVIVGSLIGFGSAFIAYIIYWENPFSHAIHESGLGSQPRLVYDSFAVRGEGRAAAADYELAPHHEDDELERSYLDLERQLPVPSARSANASRLGSRSGSPRLA